MQFIAQGTGPFYLQGPFKIFRHISKLDVQKGMAIEGSACHSNLKLCCC